MADDERHRREIAAKVAELKAKATPEKIQRMVALFEGELARRAAAKKMAARPIATAAPPKPDRPLASHALEILKRWRALR
jgi:hypothetical protein